MQVKGGSKLGIRKRAKRDTVNYALRDGRKVVYRGITNDPDRRLSEHEKSGKRFTSMTWGVRVSRDTALARERKGINSYKQSHHRKPRYNKK